jgi:hypothetical protein
VGPLYPVPSGADGSIPGIRRTRSSLSAVPHTGALGVADVIIADVAAGALVDDDAVDDLLLPQQTTVTPSTKVVATRPTATAEIFIVFILYGSLSGRLVAQRMRRVKAKHVAVICAQTGHSPAFHSGK